jgi:hypothetical protein
MNNPYKATLVIIISVFLGVVLGAAISPLLHPLLQPESYYDDPIKRYSI